MNKNEKHLECFLFLSSGNRTPGSRFYSGLLDTLADFVCIVQSARLLV